MTLYRANFILKRRNEYYITVLATLFLRPTYNVFSPIILYSAPVKTAINFLIRAVHRQVERVIPSTQIHSILRYRSSRISSPSQQKPPNPTESPSVKKRPSPIHFVPFARDRPVERKAPRRNRKPGTVSAGERSDSFFYNENNDSNYGHFLCDRTGVRLCAHGNRRRTHTRMRRIAVASHGIATVHVSPALALHVSSRTIVDIR